MKLFQRKVYTNSFEKSSDFILGLLSILGAVVILTVSIVPSTLISPSFLSSFKEMYLNNPQKHFVNKTNVLQLPPLYSPLFSNL